MIIKRVKILTDFRGLPPGYEIKFNANKNQIRKGIEPICFIGLNGSGKSNVLEVIAEIFYYLEDYHKAKKTKLHSYKSEFGFEIEYMLSKEAFNLGRDEWEDLTNLWNSKNGDPTFKIIKMEYEYPIITALFKDIGKEIVLDNKKNSNRNSAVLPSRVIGYSSGMNELISNPFIKMNLQYYNDLKRTGESDNFVFDVNRLFFLDYDSNKILSICNFLFDSSSSKIKAKSSLTHGINLKHLKSELKIDDLYSFSLNINIKKPKNYKNYFNSELSITIDDLKRCATYFDERIKENSNFNTLSLKLFFWVNEATKESFKDYFKTTSNLFTKLYFLQLMNYKLISNVLQNVINKSVTGSKMNLSDQIPKYENKKLIFFIDDIVFKKNKNYVNYRYLSDGEHQLLQVFGSLLVLENAGTLFLFDEPETHFNPEWRSKFVQLANKSINKSRDQEILLTTHSPFIVSDCKRENVFIFDRRNNGNIKPAKNPEINTFGTSASIITNRIFGKKETISSSSNNKIKKLKKNPMNTLDDIIKVKELSRELGESVEKVLLFREIIFKEELLRKELKKKKKRLKRND